jgi:hypothetical protein
MQILIYAAMLIAALVSVVMGLDVVNTAPVRVAVRPPVEIRHEAAPVQPAVPSPPPVAARQPTSQPPAPRQPATPVPSVAQQPTPQIYQSEQTTAQSQESSACNVAACTAAYRSFTASDCTYQPTEGPRKLCTRK